MKFIEMTGKSLSKLTTADELPPDRLREMGVTDESMIRVNMHGDIELRRPDRWDVIGGLIGEFADRVKHVTGLDWA